MIEMLLMTRTVRHSVPGMDIFLCDKVQTPEWISYEIGSQNILKHFLQPKNVLQNVHRSVSVKNIERRLEQSRGTLHPIRQKN
jgi:hypothetical protein